MENREDNVLVWVKYTEKSWKTRKLVKGPELIIEESQHRVSERERKS